MKFVKIPHFYKFIYVPQHCFTNHVFKDHFPCTVAETVRVCNNAILDELFNIRITVFLCCLKISQFMIGFCTIRFLLFSWKLAIISGK